MATPDERDILKIIEEEGGESHEVKIANEMGLRLVYVRTMLASMGANDYIDVLRSGKVKIADKGWRVWGKSPKVPWATFHGEEAEPPKTPKERFERYMSREAKEESSKKPEQQASDTTEEPSKNLQKKTHKAGGESHRKTIEELAEEPELTPEEKFKRYTSR